MKIRKRILTEELGLPINKKRSYTTNKKQKVVISEGQLQRLINKVNKQQPLINERIHDYDRDNPMGDPYKNPWDTYNTGGGGGEHYTPENMKACKAAGISDSVCSQALKTGIEPEDTPSGKGWGFFCCIFSPNGPCCRKWGGKWKMPKMDQGSMEEGIMREARLDKKGNILLERKPKTSPAGGYKCFKCAKGGPVGYTSYKPCPKAHSHPKKLKCCCELPNGNIVPPQSIGNQGIVCPKNALPVGGSCNSSSSSSSIRYRIDAGGCLACPAGTPASVCPYTSMPQCNTALANLGNNNSNNNVTAQCCQDPQGNQIATDCNNCVAPNTCSNCVALSENHRTLKTTNPINESEIRNMKGWFNRVNKAGNKYNPSIL